MKILNEAIQEVQAIELTIQLVEERTMTYHEIEKEWNASADEHNQWHNISEEEKVAFAFNFARGITHPGMTLREKIKKQCEYCIRVP